MLPYDLPRAIISRTRRWPEVVRICATIAIVLAVFLSRLAASHILPAGYPYLLSFIAILIAAALFDHRCGLIATVLAGLLGDWFYLPPTGSLRVERTGDVIGLCLFVLVGAAISVAFELLHRALADLQKALADVAASNADLRRSEERRGLLLREFRHRARNDLNSLVGLLRLRARAARSAAAREGLLEAAEHAMALARVHTQLAGSGDIADAEGAEVDTRTFIEGLCRDILAAQVGDGLRPVALVVEAESHRLDTERAVYLGLMLNEAVTNALKYAFPEERAGIVRVRLVQAQGDFVVTVTDDGIGLPPEGELLRAPPTATPPGSGLGTRLMRALAAQLRGMFSRHPGEGGHGTAAELRFPAAPPAPVSRMAR
ncbi:DUF4118 domain-containing protein [Siccirubricoccus sp. KC 17139]|uniref:histidine kinase n=1 Tax=Siccirubricoccus soli TaxID=2899147 RepID=A0ABT1CZ29_9PROT|nr:DUF4118 domain-containing protein [Siccirubricoccus soli]MCO6414662.1 DUF4118 domain-containing protein [Siccirubricoccus soli]MCP2680792.1 DUF4118 domain-containing protein [Siccirubricoccus soli]